MLTLPKWLTHVSLIHNMQMYIVNISLNKINSDSLHGYGFIAETATPEMPLLKIGRKGTMGDNTFQNVYSELKS